MLMVQAEDTRTAIDEIHNDARFYHQETIEHVIRIMRTQLHEPLSLEEMAEIACLSPYYFNRVFHQVIGIPPGEFLATLRLDAARHLLLTTSLSVTDICFEVGYTGLGSFTTRFTQLVGVPPRQLRQLVRQEPLSLAKVRNTAPSPLTLRGLSGHIHIFRPFKGTIFIGLFPKPIPQARPVSCTRIHAPGPYHLAPVPDGTYYLMVAAFPPSEDPHTYLLAHDVLVGVQGPLHMQQGKANGPIDVVLRAPRLTDPPILCALPFL
ncbi:AraC family transcriptional regulator [Reticulibacter mediterranei]|uniref:AraC family transcriptional regulator n=1 Tax=Reticulibacter mediterranei TaxID=2778369 RepID=A0A8J3ILI1_9CHLR|nr:AraC family transcriptional regulator [Reticulibacter mediterranei]GHO91731.1 AraC family transcriptional regulator [Reticulibacter mediterranei]